MSLESKLGPFDPVKKVGGLLDEFKALRSKEA